MLQTRASASISPRVAPRTSPGRAAVRIKKSEGLRPGAVVASQLLHEVGDAVEGQRGVVFRCLTPLGNSCLTRCQKTRPRCCFLHLAVGSVQT